MLILYYYESFIEENQHVQVSIYEDAYKFFSTSDSLKILKPLKTPGTHFIGSNIKSRGTDILEKEIIKFLSTSLNIDISFLLL